MSDKKPVCEIAMPAPLPYVAGIALGHCEARVVVVRRGDEQRSLVASETGDSSSASCAFPSMDQFPRRVCAESL